MNAPDCDIGPEIQTAVSSAAADKQALCIQGGNTKQFFGRTATGIPLKISPHRGIVDYEPSELVLTARSGTPLSEVEHVLAGAGQMLAFEPPHFGSDATLGGAIACGLSGPRRPYAGAARDFVLGVRLINGKAEMLSFGGRVMKNVAGYDISRLMVGAFGTLGVLLEISLKVLPRPSAERTIVFQCSCADALQRCSTWARQALPISATCFHDDRLYVRLSGTDAALDDAQRRIGGETLGQADRFWSDLREHRHAFFAQPGILWRWSMAPGTPMPQLQGKWLWEWGGAQRWLHSELPAEVNRKAALQAKGHANQFRGGNRENQVFHPPEPGIAALHQRLKLAFDPQQLLNPGRLFREI